MFDPTLTTTYAPPRNGTRTRFYQYGVGSAQEVKDGMRLDTLENLVKRSEIKKGSRRLLKLDIEGYELEALDAAS